MNLKFKINIQISTKQIIDLLKDSGIKRPIADESRIDKMFANANLIVSAWDNELLVGIARSLTDFAYCCYMSDLAVLEDYQKAGIGKKLIEVTKDNLGDQCMLLLLSSAEAMEYYPKIGFEKVNNAFIIRRSI